MRPSLILAALSLAACVSDRPDPQLNLAGEWEITHVNGESTGGGETFWLAVRPTTGSAQFGCNIGGGSLAVGNGWLRAGDWIVTAAGCPGDRSRFERTGFEILSEPAAIVAAGSGAMRLHNRRGTILLTPMPPPRLQGTKWKIVGLNQRDLGGVTGTVRFTPHFLSAGFCNDLRTTYLQEGWTIHAAGHSTTERGCVTETGAPHPSVTYDEEAWAIFRSPTRIERVRPDAIRLISPRGTMLLERAS